MKLVSKISIVIWLSLLAVNSLWSQTYDELIANTIDGKDINQLLPPIAELQELAIENSPVFKMLDADVKMGEYKVKQEQREWMSSFGIEGSAKYGLFDNLIISEDLGLVESNTQTTEQTRYSIGLYAKIPLAVLVDKSNLKTARAEKEKLRYQRELRIQEFRQLIIVRYNNVVKQYRGIVIKSNAVEMYRVQRLRAAEDFKNSEINVYEYARLEDMLTKSVLSLEEAKLDFATAFQILEETVGVEIKFKK